jgi:hypothetical protein
MGSLVPALEVLAVLSAPLLGISLAQAVAQAIHNPKIWLGIGFFLLT